MSGLVAAPANDPLRLDRQVCFPLYAATNLINRLYTPVLRPLGLTYPQYLVLLVLWEEQPQTVGSLGARLHLDSGTLTPLLKRMEAAGLIARRRDPADERRVLVTLTANGRDLRAKALHVPATLGQGYDPAGVDELRERVSALVAILARHDRPSEIGDDN
jgi:DNA-binding MarR family transcriptional regulator